jgi:hypothetical protein
VDLSSERRKRTHDKELRSDVLSESHLDVKHRLDYTVLGPQRVFGLGGIGEADGVLDRGQVGKEVDNLITAISKAAQSAVYYARRIELREWTDVLLSDTILTENITEASPDLAKDVGHGLVRADRRSADVFGVLGQSRDDGLGRVSKGDRG